MEGNLPYLSSPLLPALLLAPFFTRSLTLVPRSLLRNLTETLATRATFLRMLFMSVDVDASFHSTGLHGRVRQR